MTQISPCEFEKLALERTFPENHHPCENGGALSASALLSCEKHCFWFNAPHSNKGPVKKRLRLSEHA